MRYKIMGKCLPLLLAAFLCGCQETPREVEHRMAGYGENHQASVGELSFCTVAELRGQDTSKLDVELDNMVLPESMDFSGVEKLAILEMSLEEDGMENQKAYRELFGIDESSKVDEAARKLDGIVEYESPGDKKYMAVGENGFVSYFSGQDYEYTEGNAQAQGAIEKFDLDMDDISGKTVVFGGEKKEISEYQDQVERWLEEGFPMKQCSYHISDVYVRELGEAKQLSFLAEASFGGVSLNSYGVKFEGDRVYLANYGFKINCDSDGQITFFSSGDGRLRLDSSKEVEKIVDLETAVALVNTEMSGFNELEIHKLIPVYALFPKYETDEEKFGEPGQKVEGRPVYAFLIKNGEDSTAFGVNKMNGYQYIFVDMVTGQMITNME